MTSIPTSGSAPSSTFRAPERQHRLAKKAEEDGARHRQQLGEGAANEHAHGATRRRSRRPAGGTHARGRREGSLHHAHDDPGRGALGRGPRADRVERGHDPRAGRHRLSRCARGARPAARRGCGGRGRARALPARARAAARPGDRTPHVHPGRAEPCELGRDRRQRHRPRPRLRLAVRARPGGRPTLRHDRRLPQLREARLRVSLPPSLRGNGVRAGRPSGQQAAPGHGVRPPPLLRQALHGLRHAPAAGARTRSRWRASSSARTSWRRTRSS